MINAAGPGVDGIGSFSSVWAVVEAARAGASDATTAARGFLPALTTTLAKSVHATGYAIGFGAVFPVCLIGRLLPRDNPVRYGLVDGGSAGLDFAKQTLQREPAAGLPPLIPATADA